MVRYQRRQPLVHSGDKHLGVLAVQRFWTLGAHRRAASWSRVRAGIIAGAALLAATAPPSGASALTARANVYRVQAGDTLGGIAQAVGLPVARLASINHLADPDRLLAGQNLHLPEGAMAPPPGAGTTGSVLLVQPGDTLSQIALAHGTSVASLAAANGLPDPNLLRVGQQLQVPTPASSQIAAPGPSQTQGAPDPTQAVLLAAQAAGGASVHFGVAAQNLSTGATVMIRATQVFPSASTLKLPILAEYERQLTAGILAPNDRLAAQVQAMVDESDNTAANALMDTLGVPRINATLLQLGLTTTQLVNHFDDAQSPARPGGNHTSPSDLQHLLGLLATGQAVSPAADAAMRALLQHNDDHSKLVRLLPASTRVAHKSGWYPGVAADAGIVTLPNGGPIWVVAVCVDDLPDAETGNQLIAVISRALYDAWAPPA